MQPAVRASSSSPSTLNFKITFQPSHTPSSPLNQQPKDDHQRHNFKPSQILRSRVLGTLPAATRISKQQENPTDLR
jgi:hypothetical protein